MLRTHRLRHLGSLLRGSRALTASSLASELECSERTVRRCMDHLRDVEKWPIESGRFGYILREPSLAEARIRTPEEFAALALLAGTLDAGAVGGLTAELRAEVSRILRHAADVPDAGFESFEALIEVTAFGSAGGRVLAIMGELALAMVEGRLVRIRYRRLERVDSFEVDVFPHRLIQRDHGWYLIAADLERGGQRSYALPRISRVAARPMPKDFIEPEFDDRYDHAFGIWAACDPDAPLYEVCVELRGYWALLARERIWHPSQTVEYVSAETVLVRFRLNELVEVKSWVLNLGGAATVIAPPELRALVLDELTAARSNYDS